MLRNTGEGSGGDGGEVGEKLNKIESTIAEMMKQMQQQQQQQQQQSGSSNQQQQDSGNNADAHELCQKKLDDLERVWDLRREGRQAATQKYGGKPSRGDMLGAFDLFERRHGMDPQSPVLIERNRLCHACLL